MANLSPNPIIRCVRILLGLQLAHVVRRRIFWNICLRRRQNCRRSNRGQQSKRKHDSRGDEHSLSHCLDGWTAATSSTGTWRSSDMNHVQRVSTPQHTWSSIVQDRRIQSSGRSSPDSKNICSLDNTNTSVLLVHKNQGLEQRLHKNVNTTTFSTPSVIHASTFETTRTKDLIKL